jgi:predicted O-methyltransferase YrrM
MKRQSKDRFKRLMLAAYKTGLRMGVVILPNHYMTAIPDLNELERTRGRWAHPSSLTGVSFDLAAQCRNLREFCLPFEAEYRGNAAFREAARDRWGPGFGYVEAQALHGVVRHLKPTRIVEVGSGLSTRCMLEALRLNLAEGHPAELVSIEPYPSAALRNASVELIARPVQEVGFEVFDALAPGDLLFIDSSHTIKVASDVTFLILEVLPRLRPGVVVHFHDIYLPYDYPRETLRTIHQFEETALLHAYLIGNRGIRVLFCMSQLHYQRPDLIAEVFPEYHPQRDRDGLVETEVAPFEEVPGHFPSSIYLEVVAQAD